MSGNTNIYAKILYYLAKVSGLAPFTLKNNRPICNSFVDKVLTMIYALLCLISLASIVTKHFDFTFDKRSTYMLGLFIDNVGTATCLIIFFRNEVRIFDIVDLFHKLDRLFEKLSIVKDNEKFFNFYTKFVVTSSIFLITFNITSAVLTLKYIHFVDVNNTLLIIFSEIIGRLIKHHLIVIFVIVFLLIAERLKMINECLKKISAILRRTKIIPNQFIRDFDKRLTNFPSIDLNLLKEINEFCKLYDMIRDSVENTVKLFSLPLILIIVYIFWNILTAVYFDVRNVIENPNFESLLNLLLRITEIVSLVFDLLAIAFVCDKVQSLANEIPTAIYEIWLEYYPIELTEMANSKALSIYKLWIKFYPIEFNDELQMLSLHLLQRPLKIAAFGFFSLDYSYIYKMSCAIIAYLVIMVQLDPSKGNAVQNFLNQTGFNITNE